MNLPRRVTRSVLLSGLLISGVLLFYLPPLAKTPAVVVVDLPVSSFDWSTVKIHHNDDEGNRIKQLPSQPPRILPRVQANPDAFTPSLVNEARREAVRKAFKRSYDAYRTYAWMRDELMPVTGGAKDPFGGWAATLVDCLDTLWIMDFKEEFAEATAAVGEIDWSLTDIKAANMFETTIRYLGGLLSAYDLSDEPVLLRKAVELGEMLYRGFDTPNGIPPFWLDFAKAKAGQLVAGTNDASASPASLSLEFTRLSQVTGDPKYYAATDRITRFLDRIQNSTMLPGMWPTHINFREEKATDRIFSLGAEADSLYEYFPKMHALLGGVDEVYEKLFRGSMDTAIKNMLFRPMLPNQEDILFSGEYRGDRFSPESQHLTCFTGGMFSLGGKLFEIDEYVSIGERLARGCGWAYKQFPTGIMPESFTMLPCETLDPCPWDEDRWDIFSDPNMPKGFIRAQDKSFLLRPEAIESIFVSYRITAQTDLQDMAWEMFNSIMDATCTELANSAIKDVTREGPTEKLDSMESFWMAETLKYFYLIFTPPDVISLDEWVFNTEAHPLKRPKGSVSRSVEKRTFLGIPWEIPTCVRLWRPHNGLIGPDGRQATEAMRLYGGQEGGLLASRCPEHD